MRFSICGPVDTVNHMPDVHACIKKKMAVDLLYMDSVPKDDWNAALCNI